MSLVVYTFSVTLDGYIAGPNGDLSWSMPDEEMHQHFNDREKQFAMVLYGRRLYELMAAYWPTADADPAEPEVIKEYARIWRAEPKVVFSTTLREVSHNARLAGPDVEAEVRSIKENTSGQVAVGGAGLANSLLRLGLVDEIGMYVHPVVLGGGTRMFGPLEQPLQLRHIETQQFPHGIVLLRYAATAPTP